MAVEISICVATHRRPEGLERLLTSLVQQKGAPPFEVIVVDNDAGRSGEPVAARFRDRLALSYLVEPMRGLARVRNRAVAAVRDARFIAFVDDDEWASPEWLATLLRVATKFRADVVIGGVAPVFDETVPEFIRVCGLFDNPAREDGMVLPWSATRTSNALVRRDALPDLQAPFSTRFDLAGGEDVDMFRRMIDGGACVVAASDADVFEHRPVKRANLRWIMRRAVRNGGTIAEAEWGAVDRRQRRSYALGSGKAGLGYAVAMARCWWGDRRGAARHLIRACEEVGKILHLAGFRIEEYRRHP